MCKGVEINNVLREAESHDMHYGGRRRKMAGLNLPRVV